MRWKVTRYQHKAYTCVGESLFNICRPHFKLTAILPEIIPYLLDQNAVNCTIVLLVKYFQSFLKRNVFINACTAKKSLLITQKKIVPQGTNNKYLFDRKQIRKLYILGQIRENKHLLK